MKTLDVLGSDMLTRVEFDDTKGDKLIVTFQGGKRYEYQDVPWKLFALFVQVNDANHKLPEQHRVSMGRLFHYTVRMHETLYPARELPK